MPRVLLTALLALACVPAWAGNLVVDVLDVGQGDAILVRTAEKTVLIDSGDRGADTVKQLRALGVERLDLVVSTHPHADHIGRTEAVLRAFPVGLYLDNGLEHTTATYVGVMTAIDELGIPYEAAFDGQVLRLGTEATFTVLNPTVPPLSGTRSDLNSNSVVLQLDHGDDRMLFMADAEEPTEERLVANGLGHVALLKVAHHGSRHSTSPAFAKAAHPDIAIISVGVDNRYHHPADSTIDRLRGLGAMVFRTDLSGDIRAVSSGHGVEVLEGSIYELGDGRDAFADEAPPPKIAAEKPPKADKPPKVSTRPTRAERRAARQAKKSPWPIESQPSRQSGNNAPY